MIRSVSGAIAAASALCVVLVAQEPSAALREAYKAVLDNAWVRVERVHYAPHVKLPSHPHTEFAAAYVYLNASGPVAFRHHGVDYGSVTRAATKAGMFRLYRAVKEMHEVENLSALPSDFLRIEFKTEPLESALLRGRYERETLPKGEHAKVQFENAQLRVTRIALINDVFAIDKTAYPSIVVDTHAGTANWVEQGVAYTVEHRRAEPSDLLRFELKTRPRSPAN